MNKTQTKQVDPAVEEVLASIRQIMAIDLNEEEKKGSSDIITFSTAKKNNPRKRSPEGADILTLTEMIDNDGSVVSLENRETEMTAKTNDSQSKETKAKANQESSAEDSSEDEVTEEETLDLENTDPQGENESEISLNPEELDIKNISAEDVAALMSPEAVEKSTEAFKDLNKLTASVKNKNDIQSVGDQTVDQLMREMLKPLLKEWLDSHLPSLVKWLVAEKIEQMIREKQDNSKTGT